MLESSNISLDRVLELKCPDELLVERICGRRIHAASGRTYHLKFRPPKVEGKDDVTGEDLMQRKDDNEATLKARLGGYHNQTVPILTHYTSKLKVVDAGLGIEEVIGLSMQHVADSG